VFFRRIRHGVGKSPHIGQLFRAQGFDIRKGRLELVSGQALRRKAAEWRRKQTGQKEGGKQEMLGAGAHGILD
jgi:hypothetical protein